MSDDPLEWGAKPVEEDPTSWGAKPVESAPKSDFSWSKAVTDIPHEIYQEGANAAGDIGALAHRSEMGPVEGLMATGKAALAVPRMIAAPLTGAARSVLGHGMANVEHGVTSLINPDIAAKQDPAQMYEESKGDVDKAMMAARPAGAPIKVPGVTGKPAYEWQAPAAAPGATPPPPKYEPATTEELFNAANQNYSNMRGYGVEVDKGAISNLAGQIKSDLENTHGYDDFVVPKTWKAIDKLDNIKGQNATISNIDNVRKTLNKIAADPSERHAAREAIGHIDDYLSDLHNTNDVVVNSHFAHNVAEEAQTARGNYAAAKRGELIDDAIEKAERQANASGSGGNINNAIRQQLKSLRNNDKKMRGWTDTEKAQLDEVINGGAIANLGRKLGKFAPEGIVSTAGSVALGAAAGHPAALPAAGYVAKKIGDKATRSAAEKLSKTVRSRSPESKKAAINAAAQAAFAPQRPSIASSVAASVPRLTVRPSIGQIQGLVPSTAEEQKKARGGRNNQPDKGANKKHMGGPVRRAIKGYAEGGSPELSEEDQAAMSPETYANPFVKGAISGVASLPRRAIENSQYSLDTGNYDPSVPMEAAMTMTGGAGVVPAEANSLRAGIKAYHGSPHDFDRFSMDKIGTGEGAQAYGHGLYFAEKPETAKAYQEALKGKVRNQERNENLRVLAHQMSEYEIPGTYRKYNDPRGYELAKQYDELMASRAADKGKMYEVNINADPAHFLDWDKPLSEQSPHVQQALEPHFDKYYSGTKATHEAMEDLPVPSREDVAKQISGSDAIRSIFGGKNYKAGDRESATSALREAGIPGIKYLDQGSRGTSGGELVDVFKSPEGWHSKIRVDRSTLMQGAGNSFTTSAPFKTEAEARQWANDKINSGSLNYVVFDDKIVSILKKYGLAGLSMLPPATAAAVRQQLGSEQKTNTGGAVRRAIRGYD